MSSIIEKPWQFVYDTNGDGFITISDVIDWLIWLFFLPGDSFLYFLIKQYTSISRFFEIDVDNFHGILSGILSFVMWFIIYAFIYGVYLGIKEYNN